MLEEVSNFSHFKEADHPPSEHRKSHIIADGYHIGELVLLCFECETLWHTGSDWTSYLSVKVLTERAEAAYSDPDRYDRMKRAIERKHLLETEEDVATERDEELTTGDIVVDMRNGKFGRYWFRFRGGKLAVLFYQKHVGWKMSVLEESRVAGPVNSENELVPELPEHFMRDKAA